MKAAMIDKNSLNIMLPYTERINLFGFLSCKPLLAIRKEKKVIANRKRLPAIKTSWSIFQDANLELSEIARAFKITNNKTMGANSLNLLRRIILFLFRGFFYQFIHHAADHYQWKEYHK